MSQSEKRPFRILSLDGGGIRGAFSAGFVAGVEQCLGGKPVAEHFDLVAGTSTGGIIAAALVLHEPAAKIERFYRECGAHIFTRRDPINLKWWQRPIVWGINRWGLHRYGLDVDAIRQSKYLSDKLREALTGVFGERIVEESKTRLLIPSVNLTKGQTVVFKTPHLPGFFRDRYSTFVNVLMATTAAPSYFPHAVIEPGSAYIDGGVWANHPGVAAIVESMKINNDCNRPGVDFPFDLSTTSMLSIGTGSSALFAKPSEGGAGLGWWMPRLFDVTSIAQSQGTGFQAGYLLKDRYLRIDFALPDGGWSLDRADLVDQLCHIGREKAVEWFTRVRPMFFDGSPGVPYQPIPDDTEVGRARERARSAVAT